MNSTPCGPLTSSEEIPAAGFGALPRAGRLLGKELATMNERREKMTGMRKIIADNMRVSAQIPQALGALRIDMTALLSCSEKLKAEGRGVSMLSLIHISAMGMSRQRSGNWSYTPRKVLIPPPRLMMSSPIRTTRSSRFISWATASAMARFKYNCLITASLPSPESHIDAPWCRSHHKWTCGSGQPVPPSRPDAVGTRR